MKIKLGMDDVVNVGKNDKITVSELVPVKGEIFNLIKKGFEFDDEVLEKAHIKKIVRDEKINNIIVEHTPEKKKTYNNVLKVARLIMKKGYEEKESLEMAVKIFDEMEALNNGMSIEWRISQIIPKAEWESTPLHEGANIVIIKAACGG